MRKQNKTVSVFVSVFFFCREYDIINSRIQMYNGGRKIKGISYEKKNYRKN